MKKNPPSIVGWLLALVLFAVVSTPVVLVVALFRSGGYWANVRRWYVRVFSTWPEGEMKLG